MGANNTTPGNGGGIRRDIPPSSPGGLPSSQSQFIRQHMAERALMNSLDDGQAIHYNIGSGRTRAASSASSYGFESNKLPAVIKWPEAAKEVYVSGSWDNWKEKLLLHRSSNEAYTIVELSEGEHQYKYLVDGQWRHNPNEPTAMNDAGSLNNVVRVRKADFEVMEALEMDAKAKQQADSQRPGSGEWSQEVPPRSEKRHAPPMLPPALLQVILNRETPVNAEPTLLPEPNHVMLNHLYALSIKDGVMVLSNTHRYRKKYVTTLLYKPI